MLRLLNRYKKQLLQAGKIKRFLAYTVGEVFLVVVGILIALQIDNYQEEWKKAELKNSYCEALIRSFAKDTILINQYETELKISIANIERTSQNVARAQSFEEVLAIMDSMNLNSKDLALDKSLWQSLLSTGDIKVIPLTLREKLSDYWGYYDNFYESWIEIEKMYFDASQQYSSHFVGRSFKNLVIDNEKLKSDLRNHSDPIQEVIMKQAVGQWKMVNEKLALSRLPGLKQQVVTVMSEIDKELKN